MTCDHDLLRTRETNERTESAYEARLIERVECRRWVVEYQHLTSAGRGAMTWAVYDRHTGEVHRLPQKTVEQSESKAVLFVSLPAYRTVDHESSDTPSPGLSDAE